MSEGANQNNQQFLLGLFAGIAAISVVGLIFVSVMFLNKDKNAVNNSANQQQQQGQQTSGPETVMPTAAGIKTFSEKKDAKIIKEDGKPVVYLFSTTWCPHCQWVGKSFDDTVKKYVDAGKIKAYHWEIDTNDNTLTSEKETKVPDEAMAVYNEFNPDGSIPTYVFGGKYFRVGNGYEAQDDLTSEIAEFEAAIQDLIK